MNLKSYIKSKHFICVYVSHFINITIEHKKYQIFGVQFHPEYSIEEAEASLAKKLKKGERRDWILNPGLGSKLYDKTVGTTLFGNFFKTAQ